MGKRTSWWVAGGWAIGMSGCATWAPPPDFRGSGARVAAGDPPVRAPSPGKREPDSWTDD